MRIAVIGGAGRLGLTVIDAAVDRAHAVVALARTPGVADEATRWVRGDARDPTAVRKALVGAESVVVVVSGGDRHDPHQAAGTAEVVTAVMREVGVRRLVSTSAYPMVARRPVLAGWLLRRVLATPYADAAAADQIVASSGLDWTIARLNRLTDAPASGGVRTSRGELVHPAGLSRSDAAGLLVDLVESGEHRQAALNVSGR